MLPFMRHQKQASVVGTASNGSVEIQNEEGEPHPGMLAAAEDLLRAINMKDAKGIAEALHAAFQIADTSEGEE